MELLKEVDVLISCIAWEHLHLQIPFIEAAKAAGVKRFVPSEWVGPAPKGVIDIKDKVGCEPCWRTLQHSRHVAQIIAEPRTINRHVLAYTEVLSMNEIWDVMARASGEEPPKDYVRSS